MLALLRVRVSCTNHNHKTTKLQTGMFDLAEGASLRRAQATVARVSSSLQQGIGGIGGIGGMASLSEQDLEDAASML